MLVSIGPALLLFAGLALYAFYLLSEKQLELWKSDARTLAVSVLREVAPEGRVHMPLPESATPAGEARRAEVNDFLREAAAARPHVTQLAIVSCIDYKAPYGSDGGSPESMLILDEETIAAVLASRTPYYLAESSAFLVPLKGPLDGRTPAFLQVGVDPAARDQLARTLGRHAAPVLLAILLVSLLFSWMLFRSLHGSALDPILGVLARANTGHGESRVDLSRLNPDLVHLGSNINVLLDNHTDALHRLMEVESTLEEMNHRLKAHREDTGDRLRLVERERENLEKRWQMLRDSAPVGVAVLDTKTQTLVEFNSRARRMFRIDDEDRAPRANGELLRGVVEALAGGAETAEHMLAIFDPILHQNRPYRVRMRRLDGRGAGERVLLVLEDQEPLQKFEVVKNEFYAHVKRSFAGPMERLSQLLGMLSERGAGHVDLGELSQLSSSLNHEIRKLLDLETTPASPRDKTLIELDLGLLVGHSLRQINEKYPDRLCRVRNRVAQGGGLVLGDPDDLSRILVSLFDLVLEWREDFSLEVDTSAKDDSVWVLIAGAPGGGNTSLFDIKPAGSVAGAEQDSEARRGWMMKLQVLLARLEAYRGTLSQRLIPQRNRLEVAVGLPRLSQVEPGTPPDMVGRLARSFLQG